MFRYLQPGLYLVDNPHIWNQLFFHRYFRKRCHLVQEVPLIELVHQNIRAKENEKLLLLEN